MSKPKQVEIVVRGACGTGKSTVAEAIRRELVHCGIAAELHDVEVHPDGWLYRQTDRLATLREAGLVVRIRVEQVNRES